MDGNIGNGIVTVFFIFVIAAFIIGGCVVFGISLITNKHCIESKEIITPEIKLTTDGKTIDTLYIYKLKD